MQISSSDASGPGKNTDDITKIGTMIQSALTGAGMSQATAASYSLFCMDVYRYIQDHPNLTATLKGIKDTREVYDGTRTAITAANYMEKSAALGLTSAQSGFRSYGAGGGAAVLNVFVDRFEGYAKSQGIELNECSMAIVKVSLDIATAGAGAVTAVTGFGLVVTGLAVMSTFKDSYSLGQVCFAGNQVRDK